VQLIPLILAAPLAGALVLLAAGRRFGRAAGVIGSAAVAVAFVSAGAAFVDLVALPLGGRSLPVRLFTWAVMGPLEIGVDLRWDPLAAVMALTVTGVSFLIHVYSIGYMEGDERFGRFFAYLNLFVFSMLLLVLADNLILLYVGWELVGLCSYLLIGFWFERPAAATAAKKAFITTRIGDTGMLVGIFVLFAALGTFGIQDVNVAATDGGLARTTATTAAILLFAGAVGKSAQLPLYVWLPDAMEGPTPVSALIHAATMVTAGVYLVVRLNPLFEFAPVAAAVVAAIGAITALYAAVLAMAEEDIKRVLAYSTISQLGFMFLAAGVGAPGAAMFHLVTHAFFKALLFLAAGSVMHALAGETALDRMGGLRKVLPWTFGLTFIGWGAITGVVPFAGFFSKDEIMAAAWTGGRISLFVVAASAALLTAFYMTRLLLLAFAGKPRWSEGTHPHESPSLMTLPMAALAAAAVFGGVLNLPAGIRGAAKLSTFLEPVIGHVEHEEAIGVVIVMWAISAVGVLAAWWVYGVDLARRDVVHRRIGPVYTLVRQKFFVDEIYATVVASPARLLASFCAGVIDRRVIDGAVNGVGTLVSRAAGSWRHVQTGFVRSYAVGVFLGASVLVVYVVLRAG
jgi:NADH-quinone oxidoreductase subunit L